MIRYVSWAVLFGVDIFEFFRIWVGCIYIYIYLNIYTREFVSHTLFLACTHTRTRRGGWVKGQRDRGTVGHRGGGAEGMGGGGAEGRRGGGAEGRNGIMLGMFISCTSVHPCSLTG